MIIPFVKMHGLGNDFVVVDERKSSFMLTRPQLAYIADRRHGIGCDQILSVGRPRLSQAWASYRVFNADGGMAEHCGNGVRCLARYFDQRGELSSEDVVLETNGVSIPVKLELDGDVVVDMGKPRFSPTEIPMNESREQMHYSVQLDDSKIEYGAVSIGNPHVVISVEDVKKASVRSIGLGFQSCDRFPDKVNVGFMQINDRNSLSLRVHERGVGETLACGTGACAAVAVGRRWDMLDDEVIVELPGGTLRIGWDGVGPIWMSGPATYVYEGTIEL
jgi:diaminopimelate epimerase